MPIYNPISQVPIQYCRTDGRPANGYYLKFYLANSTTPISMQTDATGATSLAKCKLNENGYPISNPNDEDTVFIPHLPDTYEEYRFVLFESEANANSNTVTPSLPNIQSVSINKSDNLRSDLSASSGSSLVGHIQTGTGAVARTVQAKLRDVISTSDYSSAANFRAAKNALAANYNDMYVRSWLTPQPQLLSEEISKQRPAWYSFPRLMKKIADYNIAAPVAIKIVGFGSSVGVGASLPDPATQAPVAKFTSVIKSVLDPASIYNITAHNYCVNGSSVSESITRLDDAVAAGDTPSLCVLAYGMNDGGVAIFNAGQTYPAVYTSILRLVAKARALGSDVVLMTTPHPQTNLYTYSMPGGISQSYPTAVSAPVGAEALIPPASQSNITGDFLGDGSSITIAHRHWRVNQAMRQAATDCGIPLIDVERYWFKALQKYNVADLYDSGEIVHPNLLGHQVSYHQAITDFLYSMCYQVAQEGQEPRLNGLAGVNQSLPVAALDVHLPYPDTTSPAVSIKSRIGQTDGNGVKVGVKRFEVHNTGDIVRYAAKTTDSAAIEVRKESYLMDGTGTVIAEVNDSVTVGNSIQKCVNSAVYNVSGTVNLYTLPDNSHGFLYLSAYQGGVGRQIIRMPFVVNAGTVTLGAIETTGAGVITAINNSGLILRAVCFAANTNMAYKLEITTGI